MKIKIWPEDASMIQMNDWLAELREDGWTEPPVRDHTEPVRGAAPAPTPAAPASSTAWPADPTEPGLPSEQPLYAAPVAYAEPIAYAEPAAPANPGAYAEPAAPVMRALIGDELRMPIMWCELGSCISWHSDPAALGEADARLRAIDDGWRIDAFGRLACPRCQQTDPDFRVSRPVVAWDRYTAMARASRIAATHGDQATTAQAASAQAASAQAARAQAARDQMARDQMARERPQASTMPAGWPVR